MDDAIPPQPDTPARPLKAIYEDLIKLARARHDDARKSAHRELQAIEAAHLQLLPGLAATDDPRRHLHYLNFEVPRYSRKFKKKIDLLLFEPLWNELRAALPPA